MGNWDIGPWRATAKGMGVLLGMDWYIGLAHEMWDIYDMGNNSDLDSGFSANALVDAVLSIAI